MEEVPNTTYQLFIAYSAVFVLLSIYLYSLGRRISKIEDTVRDDDR